MKNTIKYYKLWFKVQSLRCERILLKIRLLITKIKPSILDTKLRITIYKRRVRHKISIAIGAIKDTADLLNDKEQKTIVDYINLPNVFSYTYSINSLHYDIIDVIWMKVCNNGESLEDYDFEKIKSYVWHELSIIPPMRKFRDNINRVKVEHIIEIAMVKYKIRK